METKARLREIGIANIDMFRKYSGLGPKVVSRRVSCVDDGMEFDSANAAARYYGLKNGASVAAVCRGDMHRYSADGKKFKYVDAA